MKLVRQPRATLRWQTAGSLLLLCCALLVPPTHPGQIKLTWDEISGVDGYIVHYGRQSRQYDETRTVVGSRKNFTVLTGLDDCRRWFIAVTALRDGIESAHFSNEVRGLPRPLVSRQVPAQQGQIGRVVLQGANFIHGMQVEVDNPGVDITAVHHVDCNTVELELAVAPFGSEDGAAQVGEWDLLLTNPSGVWNRIPDVFAVEFNMLRFDVVRQGPSQRKIDIMDLLRIQRHAATPVETPFLQRIDFDGDAEIGETELRIALAEQGRCWDAERSRWTYDACKADQQCWDFEQQTWSAAACNQRLYASASGGEIHDRPFPDSIIYDVFRVDGSGLRIDVKDLKRILGNLHKDTTTEFLHRLDFDNDNRIGLWELHVVLQSLGRCWDFQSERFTYEACAAQNECWDFGGQYWTAEACTRFPYLQ